MAQRLQNHSFPILNLRCAATLSDWRVGKANRLWKTEPLVRHKGQMLDFHFLNNRHNRCTVCANVNAAIQNEGAESQEVKKVALHYASIGHFLPFPGKEGKNCLSRVLKQTRCSWPSVRPFVRPSVLFPTPDACVRAALNDGRCHRGATETAGAAALSAADGPGWKCRGR